MPGFPLWMTIFGNQLDNSSCLLPAWSSCFLRFVQLLQLYWLGGLSHLKRQPMGALSHPRCGCLPSATQEPLPSSMMTIKTACQIKSSLSTQDFTSSKKSIFLSTLFPASALWGLFLFVSVFLDLHQFLSTSLSFLNSCLFASTFSYLPSSLLTQ